MIPRFSTFIQLFTASRHPEIKRDHKKRFKGQKFSALPGRKLLLFSAILGLLISYPAHSSLIAYSSAAGVKTAAAPSSAAQKVGWDADGNSDMSFTPDAEFYRDLSAARGFAAFMPQAGPETVATYAANCTTPKTTFALGDTVCVKLTNAPLGPPVQRRLAIANTAGIIVAQANVTSDPQTLTYTLPTTATSTFGSQVVDNRGPWRAISRGATNSTIRASTTFNVTDPQQAVADLAITQSASGSGQVHSGDNFAFSVLINNYGPDAAQTVTFTAAVPSNATFVSVSQASGPVFNCSSPAVGATGSTTCTIASLDSGDIAQFTFVYKADTGLTTGTVIEGTSTISSATFDKHLEDNTSTASATVAATAACVLSCPSNITVDADTGQSGAVVTYTLPTGTGDCGQPTTGDAGETIPAISCSRDSGTLFPAGTTTVVCTAANNDAVCSFQVTVNNPGGLSITLNGANPLALECGTDFADVDPGAVAVNAQNQSVAVTVSSSQPDPEVPTFIYTYTATEGTNSVSTTRTVNIVDTTPPSITLEGSNPMTIGCGQPFSDPGYNVSDTCDGNPQVVVSGTVDTNTPATYTVSYTATDNKGNSKTVTRTVIVGNTDEDNPPTITLIGDSQMTIECGSAFTDPGATASAGCAGTVPVTTSGTVDTHTPGTYTITYTATSGTLTAEATRIVTVEDTAAPIITLNGASTLTVECHSAFTDTGATANDACAGSVPVTASGAVDANTVGTYTITYTAADSSGHQATPVTRTVNVVDTTGPVITLNGSETMTVECHTSFTDPGATANDACNGPKAVTTTGTVNANTVGTYTITYSSTDGTNTSTKTRTVNVVDTIAPTVTLNGASSMTVECHTSFTDPGATASDSCAGTLPVTVTGSVNVNVPGTYTLTYSANDGTNTGSATRTVVVADTTGPVITLKGNTISLWPPNHKYETVRVTDLVLSASDSCDTSVTINSVVIAKVTSDELENSGGDGNTLNDIVIAADCKSVQLRSERDGGGNGRVYTITFRVRDSAGNVKTVTSKVYVPKSQGGGAVVDDGPKYTVTSSCP